MALDPVAVALKFGFLIVLYLFLLWMARSALKDLRRGGAEESVPAYEDATGMHHATAGLTGDARRDARSCGSGPRRACGPAPPMICRRERCSGGATGRHPARGHVRLHAARTAGPAGRRDRA